MQRVTISLDEGLATAFDEHSAEQGYQSRSEAVRDVVRKAVERRRAAANEAGHCVANLSYVYDHHVRTLAQRLVEIQHASHDLVVSTTHVHLDHDTCLESAILKGPTAAVRALADRIIAERGVRFGELNLITVAEGHSHTHAHGEDDHVHLSPHRG